MSEDVKGNRNIFLIAAGVLALSIVVGAYLLGDGLRRARMADRAVTMRGLAERNVTADLATWNISFGVQGTDQAAVQAEVDRDADKVREFFRRAGFPADVITDGGGSVNSNYDNDRAATIYNMNRRLQFRSTDVMRARAAYARQFDLIRAGVPLQEGSNMVYSFTRLNTVKPDMIHESTLDARAGAVCRRFGQQRRRHPLRHTGLFLNRGTRRRCHQRGRRRRRRRFALPEGARRHDHRILPELALGAPAQAGPSSTIGKTGPRPMPGNSL
jgi:hypothetical protein